MSEGCRVVGYAVTGIRRGVFLRGRQREDLTGDNVYSTLTEAKKVVKKELNEKERIIFNPRIKKVKRC